MMEFIGQSQDENKKTWEVCRSCKSVFIENNVCEACGALQTPTEGPSFSDIKHEYVEELSTLAKYFSYFERLDKKKRQAYTKRLKLKAMQLINILSGLSNVSEREYFDRYFQLDGIITELYRLNENLSSIYTYAEKVDNPIIKNNILSYLSERDRAELSQGSPFWRSYYFWYGVLLAGGVLFSILAIFIGR